MGKASKILDIIQDMVDTTNEADESKIVYGTVTSIDPLKVLVERDGVELPSQFFYLSDFVIAKKVKFRVHRIYGQPRQITFNGSAEDFLKALNASSLSITNEGFKDFECETPIPTTITSDGETRTAQSPSLNININEQINFNFEVVEEENNKLILDKHQDQTTIIEGVLWRGLEVGDRVLMTSHNHNQQFLIHRILNRDREQYEHGIAWDSRISDGLKREG